MGELVVWTGQATDWFGLHPTGHTSTTPPETAAALNPYNETVHSVLAGIRYTGNTSGFFPAMDGQELCSGCPGRPFLDANYSPAVLGFWFYFNVTNEAPEWESISNFTLTTSGSDPGLFLPGVIDCCYSAYASTTVGIGFLPGQTLGLAVLVRAPSLPDVGPAGFTLYLNVTSP